MKYLHTFENYEYSEIINILNRMVEGYKTSMTDIDTITDYFDEVPERLLYEGELYRFVFFNNEDEYKNALKNGVKCDNRNDGFLRCTKSLDQQEIIIDQLGAGYEYYIIFDAYSTYENCIFDVNKMCEEFGVDNSYEHEEEVIIECIDLQEVIENNKINQK